ncbi:hypothetical protein E2K80_05535 [Rhodophyticola sp. CCM32]|uniref:DUF6477 family protein n=1 Tax=Rhodophyticola sp. CCM32 TaxID=2916397 RepID=UPI00107F39B4|nr:DUF6477 family protein [Rhodophyticola sp. CCM32]QBY00262.1 hypothetical protein E2K80_05535 [Rhodophyticola sp. CCM32]
MTDLTATLASLHRPKLLVRAARFGAAALARRSTHRPDQPARALTRLLEEEETLNIARATGQAGYSPTRHVEVLTILLSAASPAQGVARHA